jgi:very-short-patch-repair endonuclease
MVDDRMRWLAEEATNQLGNITRQQSDAAGFTENERRGLIRGGVLERAGAHVLRSPFVERTALGDLTALVADCGPGAVASGPTGAAVYGWDGFVLEPPYHITIRRGRLVKRPGHHIHTTVDLDPVDCTRVSGIPNFTAERELVDLSRYASRSRLSVAVDCALRDRVTTEDRIHERMVALRSSGRHGVTKLIDAVEGVEITRGGHSWLERRFLSVCRQGRIPKPVTQQVVTGSKGRIVRVDFRFRDTMVIVEVLGYRWHRGSRAQFNRDVERMNALIRAGFHPLQFTYDHVTAQADWVINQVREALGMPILPFV